VSLQYAIAAYHVQRFPHAGPLNVAAKVGEEAGELLSAVNGIVSGGDYGKGDVVYEAVDVIMAALALVGRWYPERDALAEVEARLARFMDPNGGHRSCVSEKERQ
jgi:phosphoribosyl-ATP pyrophosphohydrolase